MTEEKLYEEERYEVSHLEKAFLIGSYRKSKEKELSLAHVEELSALAITYGFRVIGTANCLLRKIDAANYLGKGKLFELLEIVEDLSIDVVIFDEEITPNQQRNLENHFKRPVLDRTELILEIFSCHAQTKEAKLQIELAKSRYQLPRLKRLWTHLSRQTSGGKGFLKGAGERQIEIDRRLVRKKITTLEHDLKEVQRQRSLKRRARERANLPTFALVGYTNVGKSTLLRTLTDADVLVEDKLFATLDTKTRKFILPNTQEILLIDTVGFIRKIPHGLVAAFRSTLEESRYTDILVHLIDVNHPLALEHAESTYKVLSELKIEGKPMITVLNKIDLLEDRSLITQYKLNYPRVVPISLETGEGVDKLIEVMTTVISNLRTILKLRIPQKEYAVVAQLMAEGRVIARDYEESDVLLEVEVPSRIANRFSSFFQ